MDSDTITQMIDCLTAIIIFMIIVGAPMWLTWSIIKRRPGKRLRDEDAAQLAQLAAAMARMETRMAVVERIVTEDTYELNKQFRQAGDRYGQVG